MAGRGTRLRPHTLTLPKPLLPIVGKSIVQRLVEDIVKTCHQSKVNNIGFVIGDFGRETERILLDIAENLGAKGHIFYQDQPLGTGHATLCAAPLLEGEIVVAFADTLFKANFQLDTQYDAIIWTHLVEDPQRYGVVRKNDQNIITEFVEKPPTFVSNEAIIGIYYFKDGAFLRSELQYLIDNDIKDKGEYQQTSAMEHMRQKGVRFTTAAVQEWLDCGNKNSTVYSNQRVLEFCQELGEQLISHEATIEESTIIAPCFIAPGAFIRRSVVGPHVSVGTGSRIEESVVSNSIIQQFTTIRNKVIRNSMIGNHVQLTGRADDYSIGDYSTQS